MEGWSEPLAMMVAWGLSQGSCRTGLDPGVCVKMTSELHGCVLGREGGNKLGGRERACS